MKRFSGLLWPVSLLALLAILAWLQFRWTGQISVAEQERMQASLQSSVRRFADDVDDEAMALFRYFRVDEPDELASRLDRYRNEASYPGLVSEVYYYDSEAGALARVEGGAAVPVEWPPRLERWRELVSAPPERGRAPPFPSIAGDSPVVAIPVASRARRWPGFSFAGFALIALDAATLTESIFPELAGRHFGPDYDVAVVDANGSLVFATEGGSVAVDRPDARGELLSLRRFAGRPRGRGDGRRPPPQRADLRERGAKPWDVYVRHRSGSLEAFVASARTRNLAVSFGILALLATSVALVFVSTKRATELNDRKMEFVAGVSHELRTPVAVLRSAGQNLADGSVTDPEQVKRYGTLIESEGLRLNDLVEQVLELAGIQSQKRRYVREPVSAEALVADALEDCESLRRERGVEITTRFPSEGARLVGNPSAMRRAVANVVMNAVKHGGDDNAIEVTAERRGPQIAIVVTDRGPGIATEDQKHLFEPFYRGARAQARQVPGSGLGLSLVDHIVREHGGSIEVDSAPGRGSRFTLYFPADG